MQQYPWSRNWQYWSKSVQYPSWRWGREHIPYVSNQSLSSGIGKIDNLTSADPLSRALQNFWSPGGIFPAAVNVDPKIPLYMEIRHSTTYLSFRPEVHFFSRLSLLLLFLLFLLQSHTFVVIRMLLLNMVQQLCVHVHQLEQRDILKIDRVYSSHIYIQSD